MTSKIGTLSYWAGLTALAIALPACGDDGVGGSGTEGDSESTTGEDTMPPPTTLPPSTADDTTMGSADDTTTTAPGTDTDPATDTGTTPECGNGIVEEGEVCDSDDLDGATCRGEGFGGGELACARDCQSVDTSACVAVCQSFRFDPDVTVYALPGMDYPADGDFPTLSGVGDCNAGASDWATTDIDGDGFLDLVITDDATCTGVTVSEAHWLVHLGDATGFAQMPVEWALPGADFTGDGDFPTLSGNGSCQQGLVDWSTFDVDGDGRLDLVITDDAACTMQVIGEEYWLVYPGNGTGFDAAPTQWAVPGMDYAFDGDFFQPSFGGDCNQGLPGYATTDITGDGLLDLVITDASDCMDTDVGETHWLVHAGGAGGFDPVATSFALPGLNFPGASTFVGLGGGGNCNQGLPGYATIDIDGDGYLDLVITNDVACTGGPVGETEWLVYLGDGTGFAAAPMSWALPGADYLDDGDFDALAGQGDCQQGFVDWVTVDIDADGWVDLVVTDDPACTGGPISETEWLVYNGDGTGFAAAPMVWSLPGDQYTPDGDFPQLSGAGDCNVERVDWATVDLGNDGFLDLVITDDPACAGGPIGEIQWSVHAGCVAP